MSLGSSFKLFVPGPVEIDEETRQVGAQRLPYMRTAAFSAFTLEVMDDLRRLVGTTGEVAILTASGTAFLPAFRERLASLIAAGQCHHWWEDALYSMIPEGVPVYSHDVAGIFWGEVDYVKDYERLQSWTRVREAA